MKRYLALFVSSTAWACPFCELGSQETALFILTIFGLFVGGMGLIAYAFYKAGGFSVSSRSRNRVLDVEGVKDE